MDTHVWQAMLGLSDDMLIVVDADLTIRWISRRAARLIVGDRSPSRQDDPSNDVVGRPIDDLLNDSSLQQAFQRVLASGNPRRILVVLGPEGPEVEARIVPIRPHDNVGNDPDNGGGRGSDRDGSTTVQAIVIAMSELEPEKRLQSMRREFVANVSHELRSPLTSIVGYSETLLDDPPEDEEQRHRFLLSIVREARRMQRLVEDLLNLSQIESGRDAPRFEGVNLHNIVGHVLTQLRSQAVGAGVTLQNKLPPELRLECDRGQIEQVVYNLVSNGIQYTPKGGRVVVSGHAEGNTVSLQVTDTGMGIPPADLPRVFERFYRVDKARSRATGATGLGLSIVKHIVDAHHGTVSVTSKMGEGASFTVRLPATQPPVR